jgi:hypothetical protein
VWNLFNQNPNFEECITNFAEMLAGGEFDPQLKPLIESKRKQKFETEDPWKVSKF